MKRERQLRNTPARPAIRLVPPEPPRHLAFPGGGAELPDLPQPISHVARRRISSAPAHEVELEELELLDELELIEEPKPNEGLRALAAPAGAPSWQPPSIAPLAMDAPSKIAPIWAPPPAASRSWRRPIVAGVAVTLLAAGIAAGAFLRPGGAGSPERIGRTERTEPAAAASPVVLAAAPAPVEASPAPAVAVVDVATLPRPHEGTILGAHGHRLWVDGHLVDGSTAVVACGRHVVQVGSAGTPRDVSVPCGDAVAVLP
jgi:hypothetical protein